MKPRIFISSTFYDLKYIREDLANFVRAYDYEPILFEDGDIGYTPGKNLDKSCYEAMKNSDMVILIIGGEYGSAASGEEKDDFKEYMSVTRKEFRTAIETGIPVFVMIDKKVMTEYGVYEVNYDSIEKENNKMKFPSTKNINVFRFIKEVKSLITLPIQEFEKSSDIKGFISKQWADMFKNYLTILRLEKENRKVESSVNEMRDLIQKMNIMLDSVGRNVLAKDDPKEYESVIIQQDILSYCQLIEDSFLITLKENFEIQNIEMRRKVISEFLEALKKTHVEEIWSDFLSDNPERVSNFLEIFNKENFYVEFILEGYPEKAKNKYKILLDEKNIEKIIEIMIEDTYFDNLTNIIL